MKNLKKVLALALSATMAVSMFVTGAGAAFTDDGDIKSVDAVNMLSSLGVIKGYEDGSYKPEAIVTRGEMAKMIFTILNGGSDNATPYEGMTTTFQDVNSHWAKGYIKYCQASGIIAGKSATVFAPEETVTGLEAAKMMLVAAGYDADKAGLTGPAWSQNTLKWSNLNSLLEDVDAPMTSGLPRQYAAQLLYNGLDMERVVYSNDINGFKPSTDVSDDKTIGGKYMDLVTYEGVLEGSGEFGSGKDKIAVDAEKINGSTLDTNVSKTFTYKTDVTNLVGRYVKVSTGKNDKVYGVFEVSGQNTVVTANFSKVKIDGSKIKVDGTSYSYNDVAIDGVEQASGNTLKISELTGDAHAEVKSGDQITFISNDGDSKFDVAYVNPMTEFGKVTYVGTDEVTAAGETYKTDDGDIIPELKKDDYVAVYEDLYTGNNKLVLVDKIEGKVSSTKTDDSDVVTEVKVDGNWYVLGNKTANRPFLNAVTMMNSSDVIDGTGAKVVLYVVNGIIYRAEASSSASTDTAYVIAAPGTLDTEGNEQFRLMFADGSNKVVGAIENNEIAAGNVVTYDVVDGAYELKEVKNTADHMAGGDSVHLDATKFDKATKRVIYGAGGANSVRVSSNAVVYVKYEENSRAKYKVLSGSELNSLGADFGTGSSGTVVIDGGLASVVALQSTDYLPGANANKMYGYITSSVTNEENENTKYKEFTVWTSAGESVVVKMKSTGTAVAKKNLISFDMTSDNFVEGVTVLSTTAGAIKEFSMGDYVTFHDGKDLEMDDDVKYIYVNSKDVKGVADDRLVKATETTAPGVYFNNAMYFTEGSGVNEKILFIACEVTKDQWDDAGTTDTNTAVTLDGATTGLSAFTAETTGKTATAKVTNIADGETVTVKSITKSGDTTDLKGGIFAGTAAANVASGKITLTVKNTNAVTAGNYDVTLTVDSKDYTIADMIVVDKKEITTAAVTLPSAPSVDDLVGDLGTTAPTGTDTGVTASAITWAEKTNNGSTADKVESTDVYTATFTLTADADNCVFPSNATVTGATVNRNSDTQLTVTVEFTIQ